MHARLQRRSNDVVIEKLDDGMVIYDRQTDQAHSLDRVAAQVFDAADGTRTETEIARETGLGEASVCEALAQLRARGLLVAANGVSRRTVMRRAVAIGAAATAAAPLIETVIIPTAAAHASTLGTTGGGGAGGGNPGYPGATDTSQVVAGSPASYTIVGHAGTQSGQLQPGAFLGQGGAVYYDYNGNAQTATGYQPPVGYVGEIYFSDGSGGYTIRIANNSGFPVTVAWTAAAPGSTPGTQTFSVPTGTSPDFGLNSGWQNTFVVSFS